MATPDMAFKLPNLSESAAALRWARRLLLLQGRLRSNEPTQILACAAFGAVIGAVVAGLHWLVDWLHHVAFKLPAISPSAPASGSISNRILIVPALGGLILGLGAVVMRRYRPNDVIDPIEANALHGGRMSLKDSLRLTVATVWSNGSGVSVGMEAGYSQIGAAVLAKVGQYFRLRREDQRIFVAAGAGAAIAAAFNTPLAGAFYGYELILGGYSVRALAPIAAAALSATVALRVLVHPEVMFVVQDFVAIPQWFYWLFALLGVLAAAFSVLAMRSVTWSERLLKSVPVPQWLRPAMRGVLVTVIALVVPQVLGGGHGTIQLLFDNNPGLLVLTILLVTKLVASGISLGAGFRGGMFCTSLLLGALLGGSSRSSLRCWRPSRRAPDGPHDGRHGVGGGGDHRRAAHHGVPGARRHRQLPGDGRRHGGRGDRLDHRAADLRLLLLDLALPSARHRHPQSARHRLAGRSHCRSADAHRYQSRARHHAATRAQGEIPAGRAKHVLVVSEGGAFVGTLDMAASTTGAGRGSSTVDLPASSPRMAISSSSPTRMCARRSAASRRRQSSSCRSSTRRATRRSSAI